MVEDGIQILGFLTPMITANGIPVFLKDCAAFSHPQFGVTKATIVKFFQKVCITWL